ncbi:hypothetical protein FRC02_000231 [Tulasnella sp. 418]|nr:hypothetical protein FRC02_000231 [Tulasnella sp. 418]
MPAIDGNYCNEVGLPLFIPSFLLLNSDHSWCNLFQQNLYSTLWRNAKEVVEEVIHQIELSAAPALKERCAQGAVALENANTILTSIITASNKTLQQK